MARTTKVPQANGWTLITSNRRYLYRDAAPHRRYNRSFGNYRHRERRNEVRESDLRRYRHGAPICPNHHVTNGILRLFPGFDAPLPTQTRRLPLCTKSPHRNTINYQPSILRLFPPPQFQQQTQISALAKRIMNPVNTSGYFYAKTVALGSPIPPPPNPLQPWIYFLDHDPWAFQKSLPQNPSPTTHKNQPPPLSLPPNPATSEWRGRCYNCLEIGHDQNDCPTAERVCAKCWLKGHQARDCSNTTLAKRKHFDPLQPRGNLGDDRMPPNRPKLATVFIPETRQMYLESMDLNRAVVIDARLRPNHSDQAVQSVIMGHVKLTYHYRLRTC